VTEGKNDRGELRPGGECPTFVWPAALVSDKSALEVCL